MSCGRIVRSSSNAAAVVNAVVLPVCVVVVSPRVAAAAGATGPGSAPSAFALPRSPARGMEEEEEEEEEESSEKAADECSGGLDEEDNANGGRAAASRRMERARRCSIACVHVSTVSKRELLSWLKRPNTVKETCVDSGRLHCK